MEKNKDDGMNIGKRISFGEKNNNALSIVNNSDPSLEEEGGEKQLSLQQANTTALAIRAQNMANQLISMQQQENASKMQLLSLKQRRYDIESSDGHNIAIRTSNATYGNNMQNPNFNQNSAQMAHLMMHNLKLQKQMNEVHEYIANEKKAKSSSLPLKTKNDVIDAEYDVLEKNILKDIGIVLVSGVDIDESILDKIFYMPHVRYILEMFGNKRVCILCKNNLVQDLPFNHHDNDIYMINVKDIKKINDMYVKYAKGAKIDLDLCMIARNEKGKMVFHSSNKENLPFDKKDIVKIYQKVIL